MLITTKGQKTARILLYLTGILTAVLILCVIVLIILHPTITAHTNLGIVILIDIVNVISPNMSFLYIVGGVPALYLALGSQKHRKGLIALCIALFLLSALFLMDSWILGVPQGYVVPNVTSMGS